MTKKALKAVRIAGGNEKLLHAAKTDAKEIMAQYGNTEQGFSLEQVEEMRDKYGENIITHQEKETLWKKVIKSFINPFTVILFALAVISLVTDVIFAGFFNQTPDATAVIIVLSMVTISGLLRFMQEIRSSKAAEKLKAMIKTTTCVLRDGQKTEIPLGEIVVGDIICLAAGDMIPADIRILSAKDLFVSESSLTGESNPVEKIVAVQKFQHTNSLESANLAFMGGNVVSGSATGIVIAIGDDTHFGLIAQSLTSKKRRQALKRV